MDIARRLHGYRKRRFTIRTVHPIFALSAVVSLCEYVEIRHRSPAIPIGQTHRKVHFLPDRVLECVFLRPADKVFPHRQLVREQLRAI